MKLLHDVVSVSQICKSAVAQYYKSHNVETDWVFFCHGTAGFAAKLVKPFDDETKENWIVVQEVGMIAQVIIAKFSWGTKLKQISN